MRIENNFALPPIFELDETSLSEESSVLMQASLLFSLRKTIDACVVERNQRQDSAEPSIEFAFKHSPPSEEYYDIGTLSPSDIFHFGDYCWDSIKKDLSKEKLYDVIHERRSELATQKDHWRPWVRHQFDQEFLNTVNKALEEGTLSGVMEGAGSAYFLLDANNNPVFVIKPVDEDIHCLNNRKHMGSPFRYARVRDDVPLYRSAQTDVLCYLVAQDLGIPDITPRAAMVIVSYEGFYDIASHLEGEELQQFLHWAGPADKEKLCSVQEYVVHSKSMQEALHSWLNEELTDEQIEARIDQQDFEEANLFLWATYDTDAHFGNFRVYVKYLDSDGHAVYGIKKIDNGLSFPERNSDFLNVLMYLPNAQRPLSQNLKDKVASIPLTKILDHMQDLEMLQAGDAFVERVQVLQELAQREGITLYEINVRLSALEYPNGRDLALGEMTLEDLEKLLSLSSNTHYSSQENDSSASIMNETLETT